MNAFDFSVIEEHDPSVCRLTLLHCCKHVSIMRSFPLCPWPKTTEAQLAPHVLLRSMASIPLTRCLSDEEQLRVIGSCTIERFRSRSETRQTLTMLPRR